MEIKTFLKQKYRPCGVPLWESTSDRGLRQGLYSPASQYTPLTCSEIRLPAVYRSTREETTILCVIWSDWAVIKMFCSIVFSGHFCAKVLALLDCHETKINDNMLNAFACFTMPKIVVFYLFLNIYLKIKSCLTSPIQVPKAFAQLSGQISDWLIDWLIFFFLLPCLNPRLAALTLGTLTLIGQANENHP